MGLKHLDPLQKFPSKRNKYSLRIFRSAGADAMLFKWGVVRLARDSFPIT
jgi:hypothetical protein